MKVNQKFISKSLLGFIGGQVLFVAVGLSNYQLPPNKDMVIRKIEPIGYYHSGLFRDETINNLSQYAADPMRSKAGEFKIHVMGATTTGTSGDCTIMEFPVS